VFFFIVAVSGLLLGWKKHSGGMILAKTHQGKSTNPQDWMPIHRLREKAVEIGRDRINPQLSDQIERIDVRADKGIVKFVFVEAYWGVQLDLTTGEMLQIERRWSDLIEHIHDGTLVDELLGIENGWFKLFYTSVMGMALLTFTITGFWLWYGPKQFRHINRERGMQ